MLLPGPSNHPVVLLGSAGTGTAFGAASALRRHWSERVTIVAMDTNPRYLVTASLLCDGFEQVPPSDDEAFPAALLAITKHYRVDTYLPLVDIELVRAAELRDSFFLPRGIRVLAPPLHSARICLDKYLAALWMEKHAIPTPQTALASQAFRADHYFLKPRQGFGSRGTRKIARTELDRIPESERDDWIVQALCSGPEVTVDVFHDPGQHFVRIACRERIETKSGVCTKARVFFDSDLEALACQLGRRLALSGTFCFQVMHNDGRWYVTDINARPGAGTAISVAAGLDFFAALFAHAWAIDVRQVMPMLIHDRIVTRQYSEFVMN
jgi:carbamoylphosphate synthase large subunit